MHSLCKRKICVHKKGGKVLRKDEDIVGTMLHDVAHLIRLRIDEALKPFDLTRVAWLAIGIVVERDRLSQSQLAEALELGSPATGKLVDRLEHRGLVERLADPQDRRTNQLTATAEAKRLLNELEPVAGVIREDVLKGFTAAERHQLARFLFRIKAGLSGRVAVDAA